MEAARTFRPPRVAAAVAAGDLIGGDDPRHGIIWQDPGRLGGRPCFYGTRVPVQTLFDYLAGGETIDDFIEGFPPITREHVLAVLDLAQHRLLDGRQAA